MGGVRLTISPIHRTIIGRFHLTSEPSHALLLSYSQHITNYGHQIHKETRSEESRQGQGPQEGQGRRLTRLGVGPHGGGANTPPPFPFMTSIYLTDKTLDAMRSEFGPICTPHDSLEDLANSALQQYCRTIREARLKLEENMPVSLACD